jgi:hypothetical protein
LSFEARVIGADQDKTTGQSLVLSNTDQPGGSLTIGFSYWTFPDKEFVEYRKALQRLCDQQAAAGSPVPEDPQDALYYIHQNQESAKRCRWEDLTDARKQQLPLFSPAIFILQSRGTFGVTQSKVTRIGTGEENSETRFPWSAFFGLGLMPIPDMLLGASFTFARKWKADDPGYYCLPTSSLTGKGQQPFFCNSTQINLPTRTDQTSLRFELKQYLYRLIVVGLAWDPAVTFVWKGTSGLFNGDKKSWQFEIPVWFSFNLPGPLAISTKQSPDDHSSKQDPLVIGVSYVHAQTSNVAPSKVEDSVLFFLGGLFGRDL